MKSYYHVDCLLDSFAHPRKNQKIIESSEEIEGWENLEQKDKDSILQKLKGKFWKFCEKKT